MTVRVDKGVTRVHTGDFALDQIQRTRDTALLRASQQLLAAALPVFGEPDTTAFGGISDGITFTTGQTKNVFHGLGREPAGFIVIDARTSAPVLIRTTTGLDSDLKKTHIRLTHGGASTTIVKLLVF